MTHVELFVREIEERIAIVNRMIDTYNDRLGATVTAVTRGCLEQPWRIERHQDHWWLVLEGVVMVRFTLAGDLVVEGGGVLEERYHERQKIGFPGRLDGIDAWMGVLADIAIIEMALAQDMAKLQPLRELIG